MSAVRIARLVGPLFLVACADAATVPPAQPPGPASSAAPTASAAGGAELPGPPAGEVGRSTAVPRPESAGRKPVEITPPADVACHFPVETWNGLVGFRPGGPAFARIVAGGSLDVPTSGEGVAFARLGDATLKLAMWAQSVTLHLAKPRAVAGILYPKARAALPWRGDGQAGSLLVSFDVSDVLASSTEAREELPCGAMSPLTAEYGDRDALPVKGTGEEVALLGEVPISPVPGAVPVARFRAGAGGPVLAFAKKKDARFVVLERRDFLVAGWVPASSIGENRNGYGTLGVGTFGESMRQVGHSSPLRCPHELAVFGEQGGERARVGVLAAGSSFVSDDAPSRVAGDGLVAVAPVGRQWLRLEPGSVLAVRSADLAGCR
jgi:hypothetical protein